VRNVVLAAARNVDFTLLEDATHHTQVWLTSFGDSALNFELIVWPNIDAVKRPAAMQAAYTWAIDDALRAAGIEIPFPQRDLRIRTVFDREGEDAFRALGYKPKPLEEESAERAMPGHNDAAQDLLQPVEAPPQAKTE
jgi:small-conductance mechanosensitive channel